MPKLPLSNKGICSNFASLMRVNYLTYNTIKAYREKIAEFYTHREVLLLKILHKIS